jgi:VIT1/CCC1 family predicted Fe2+/Mn2+ transporter
LESAGTIAVSYILGGMIPLVPYMVMTNVNTALLTSIGFTLLALLIFGYIKGYFTGTRPLASSIQTMLIGALASAAAFGIALLIRDT